MTTLSPPPGFGVPHQQSPPQLRQLSPPQPQDEKSKRSTNKSVSWANSDNLCQVRLFVAEDAPAMSGSAQDQLQAKPTRNLHIFNSSIPPPGTDAPPGFGGVPVKSQPDHMALAAIVPQISWRPPSTVHLDPTWHVMAGGASLEIGKQKQREVRILEAVYPRPSSIPESPAEPLEAEEPYDDSRTSQIPLVPLDEEDSPDRSDVPNQSSGPSFPSQGPSGQVAGVQMTGLSNGRQDKVKQSIGNSLPVPMQEISNARKDPLWGNASVGSTPRLVDHSSNGMSGRPPLAGLLPDHVHMNSKQNGVLQPDVAAATAAALASISKEMGSMIDNELLIKILNDPSLILSLQAKLPSATTTNSKPELSSNMNNLNGLLRGPDSMNYLNGVSRGPDSMNHLNGVLRRPDSMNHLNGVSRGPDSMNHLNGVSRGPDSMNHMPGMSRVPDSMNLNGMPRGSDKINLGQVMNGVVGPANHWISPPSTSYMTLPAAVGQDGSRSRSSESYMNAGERFQRTQGPDERLSTLPPGAVGNSQLYTDPTNLGRGVGLGQHPTPSSKSDAPPPGFSSSKANVNTVMLPSFASKSASQPAQTGVAPPLGASSSRPLSRQDEQYFKNLIMQHGNASGDDQGRAGTDEGDIGTRSGNLLNTTELKRWYRREQLDTGRPERSGRDRQENERTGPGSGAENLAVRGKSRKVCIYFGTARGCRNGDNCPFVHEISEAEKKTDRTRSAPSTQVPYAKRLKVDS